MLVNRIHNDLVIALDDSVVVVVVAVVDYNIVVVEKTKDLQVNFGISGFLFALKSVGGTTAAGIPDAGCG